MNIHTTLALFLLSFPMLHLKAQNPIIPDMIADPSIQKIGDTYFCYSTTDGWGSGLSKAGNPVLWQSKDFKRWSFEGLYFPEVIGHKYWAPSKVIFANGKYYLYPTVDEHIRVAVADSPKGPFHLTKLPILPLSNRKGTKDIDAEVFIDDDGQGYLYWAMRGAARLNKNKTSIDTTTIVQLVTKRKGYSEGPIFFKRKDIYYYLYTLGGHEKYQYAYIYSKVSPLGPFIYPERDIILTTDTTTKVYGPGHGCVFNEPDKNNWYVAYLEFGIGGTNRQVFVNRLSFNKDGTILPIKLSRVGAPEFTRTKNSLTLLAKASATSCEADYQVKPIKDSTLKRKETYSASNAVDEKNDTRWMALSSDTKPCITLDLERKKRIDRTEIYFVRPAEEHAYLLEYSTDGKRWNIGGLHTTGSICSPHTDRLDIRTRYLRVTILEGTPGIWELKAY